MLGFFTAVSKAPVTGIILIIEITQTVPIFLSLAFVAILSYLITEVFGSEPIYDVLMKRLIADNK
jgi:H+/Cl- antiporter ClcA